MNNWQLLSNELDQWPQKAQFWWRDDDAVADSQALQKMLSIAAKYAIPVHLAVIPQSLQSSLAVITEPQHKAFSYALQHGVEHKSYALEGQRKIELGGSQDIAQLTVKLIQGRQQLKAMFEQQYLDILVPPWNRISPEVVATLEDIGYQKLSVLGSQKLIEDPLQLNVNIDIINWRERQYAGDDKILTSLIEHLRIKREYLSKHQGANAQVPLAYTRPCGLMTHHLDHDLACWQFLEKFFSFCQQHSQVEWVSGKQLYQY